MKDEDLKAEESFTDELLADRVARASAYVANCEIERLRKEVNNLNFAVGLLAVGVYFLANRYGALDERLLKLESSK